MWIQLRVNETDDGEKEQKNETTIHYYKAKPCNELYNETKLMEEHRNQQLWKQISGMMCPDMGNETWHLRNGDKNADVIADKTFFFVIDSCERFKNYTKQEDCKT